MILERFRQTIETLKRILHLLSTLTYDELKEKLQQEQMIQMKELKRRTNKK
jgi:hypothetical protein